MKDLSDSLVTWWREKTSGPLYFTYLIFLLGWNWRTVYVLFFDSKESLEITRLEYFNTFIEFHYFGPWFDPLLNTVWTFVPPIILTFLAIRYLPYVNAWAHDWHLKHYFSRKEAWDEASLKYDQKQTSALKERAEAAEEKKAVRTKLENILSPEEKWEDEGVRLDEAGVDAVRALFRIVYKTFGRFSNTPNATTVSMGRSTYVTPDILARIDGLGIADIDFGKSEMSLTGKGKYFIKRLQEQKRI